MSEIDTITDDDDIIEASEVSTEPTSGSSSSTVTSNDDEEACAGATNHKNKKIIKKKEKISVDVEEEKKEKEEDDEEEEKDGKNCGGSCCFFRTYEPKEKRRLFLLAGLTFVVLVAIAIGLGLHFAKEDKTKKEHLQNSGSGEGGEGGAVTVQFGGVTPGYYPNPNGMKHCSEDPDCHVIMDGLGPVIPPGTVAIFHVPDTCQSLVRDWIGKTTSSANINHSQELQQRYALGVVYCELNGELWIENQSWLSELHICDWFQKVPRENEDENGYDQSSSYHSFVTRDDDEAQPSSSNSGGVGGGSRFTQVYNPDVCNSKGELEVLSLHRNNLHGTIPPELSMFSTSLKVLDLSYNLITGTIPFELSILTNLQYLNLGYNVFNYNDYLNWRNVVDETTDNEYDGYIYSLYNYGGSGEQDLLDTGDYINPVPRFLFHSFPDLKYFDISYNNFDGPLPTNSITSSMSKLQVLNLQNNNFDGTIPLPTTSGMTTTEYEGSTIWMDTSMKILTTINLSNNRLVGPITPLLEFFSQEGDNTKVQEIYLHGNDFNGTVNLGFDDDVPSSLRTFTLHDNPKLLGTIGSSMCCIVTNNQKQPSVSISVDCTNIQCDGDCCTCE